MRHRPWVVVVGGVWCAVASVGCGTGKVPKPDSRVVAGVPFTVLEIAPENGSAAAQLSHAARAATVAGLHPFVELTSDWCRACHWLDHSLATPSLATAFGGTYIVRIDIDHWEGRLGGTGLDDHVGPLPAFIALTSRGVPVGGWIDPLSWGSDVPTMAAPVLADFFHP